MTPLRLQMIEDMKSAGLAATTQTVYIDAVRRLAAHYRRSPDRLSEEEVRRYCSACVIAGSRSARSRPIRRHPIPLSPDARSRLGAVSKKRIRPPKQLRLPEVLSDEQVRALLGGVRNPSTRPASPSCTPAACA